MKKGRLQMFRRYGSAILFAVVACLVFWVPVTVHGDTINYQALKYGTNQTSLATNYYVRPATVTVNGDQYLVTMTIHTGRDLGQWPVTVLSINGTGPANVRKTQSASGYDYSYAFQTADLTRTINSSISINVPKVYVAKHDISFKFDTSRLPKLAQASSSAATSSNAKSTTPKPSRDAKKPSSKEKVRKQATAADKQQVAAAKALNKQNKQTQWAILIGGSVAVIILAVAAYFFIKRK